MARDHKGATLNVRGFDADGVETFDCVFFGNPQCNVVPLVTEEVAQSDATPEPADDTLRDVIQAQGAINDAESPATDKVIT